MKVDKRQEQQEILKGIIAGDERIIKDFYKNNLPKITSYVMHNSGNAEDAEDVFQDAFVFTYRKLKQESLMLNCSVDTYVFAVGKNIWMNKLRKNRKILFQEKLPEVQENLDANVIEAINQFEKQSLYQKYFLRLEENCQKLLLLFFSGKSMKGISESMEYTEGYARKKKFDCKKRLMEMLEKDRVFDELKTNTAKTNT